MYVCMYVYIYIYMYYVYIYIYIQRVQEASRSSRWGLSIAVMCIISITSNATISIIMISTYMTIIMT